MSTLNELIEANQFLQLPRLSSQPVFDSLCPPESSKSRRRLCVLLISGKGGVDSADEDGRRQALREFIADTRFSKDRVRFAYVLEDKQADFVKSLINGEPSSEAEGAASSSDSGTDKASNLAIVWRRESHSIRFQVGSPRHFFLSAFSCMGNYIDLVCLESKSRTLHSDPSFELFNFWFP